MARQSRAGSTLHTCVGSTQQRSEFSMRTVMGRQVVDG
uniref:Uncharacterized protein n=1 Tax=Arundo donax TaxID=35708 RepID=A0A0A8ZII5_ARUDO